MRGRYTFVLFINIAAMAFAVLVGMIAAFITEAAGIVEENGLAVHLSITHEAGLATAFTVVEKLI